MSASADVFAVSAVTVERGSPYRVNSASKRRRDSFRPSSVKSLADGVRNIALVVKPFHCVPVEAPPSSSALIARNVTDVEEGFLRGTRHLILDRDTKYTGEFRKVLVREGIHLIRLPAAVTEFEGRQKVHYEAPPAARRPHRRGPRCARRPSADIHALLRSPARGRRGGGHRRLRMRAGTDARGNHFQSSICRCRRRCPTGRSGSRRIAAGAPKATAPLQEMRNQRVPIQRVQGHQQPPAKKKWRRCFAARNLKIVGTCLYLRFTRL